MYKFFLLLLLKGPRRSNATTQCRNTTVWLRKPKERYYTMQEHYCMIVEAEGTLLHNVGTLLQDYGSRRNATTQCRNTTVWLWKPKERYYTMQEHYCRTMEAERTLPNNAGTLLQDYGRRNITTQCRTTTGCRVTEEGMLLYNVGTLLQGYGRRNVTIHCRNTTAGLRKKERYYTL